LDKGKQQEKGIGKIGEKGNLLKRGGGGQKKKKKIIPSRQEWGKKSPEQQGNASTCPFREVCRPGRNREQLVPPKLEEGSQGVMGGIAQ